MSKSDWIWIYIEFSLIAILACLGVFCFVCMVLDVMGPQVRHKIRSKLVRTKKGTR